MTIFVIYRFERSESPPWLSCTDWRIVIAERNGEARKEIPISCHQCRGIEILFNSRTAERELRRYRKKGPSKSTLILVSQLKAYGIEGMELLDIGGGVGAVHHTLLNAGIRKATDVDASSGLIAVAKRESEYLGHAGKVRYRLGNFVELAPKVEVADITTLDRVICCYNDMLSLVGQAARRTRRYLGAVYPRNTILVKLGIAALNLILKVAGNPFRVFAHPTKEVDALLRSQGLSRIFYRKSGLIWQIVVYERHLPSD